MATAAVAVHTLNTFEDLSGTSTPISSDNPYDGLIDGSHNDPAQIQARYSTHRATRNTQQKTKLLAPDFSGVTLDPILQRLYDPTIEPGYTDPRHCFVFWARPPQKVKALIADVQEKLRAVAPNLWLMPTDCLHMTALEITHSRTDAEIKSLVETMHPSIPTIVDYTLTHRARLVKPMIGFDAQALALSFVPAAGEALPPGRTKADDKYTYHHLRRDLYTLSKERLKVDSRYVVPSSHLTIGRFITAEDFSSDGKSDPEKMRQLVEKIEGVNEWLQAEYWPKENDAAIKDGGEWIVGQEKGLDCREGTLWYGGGKTVQLGRGF
ncbi:hypothetical protein W97_04785 [Coniosporium apollinis CBS 100218]|uniref:Uncharacterized protein n=1 Tax=Coniosporium apollinis (strain CBS 100218) TaxID=1168221 RepID=R7YUG7_CONA1|nr:uncharacterized protein W97_04785 [Coniosporium apollinis CBS 100218]EON65547.1 hypothetical protein W97_04785 [Coniosporium apollinis CBS 100218]